MKNKLTILSVLLILNSIAQNPGVRFENMDTTVNPKNDFYNYCNGNWMKTFNLPESDSRYGSFNEINENNLKNIQTIYKAAALNKTAKPGSNEQKLRDFYLTAMDSAKADKLGYTPIKALLQVINDSRNKEDIIKLKARIESLGVHLFYGAGVQGDLKNSQKNAFYISQGGYGLPGKDFYYQSHFEKITEKYKQHIANMLNLIGEDKTKTSEYAQKIFDFEKKILDKGKTSPEMRDMEKLYNPINKNDLAAIAPLLDFPFYFKTIGIKQPDTVIITNKEYFSALIELLYTTDLSTLKLYCKWHLINEAAPYLSSDFVNEHFNFYGSSLSGAKVQKVRWMKVHNVVNGTLGDIISEAYVKTYFPPSSKEKLNILIDNLIAAYRERIDSRDWMEAETKKQAHRKLDLLIRKIGYPDTWKDYSKVAITTTNYWDNVCKANVNQFKEDLADLTKPVDRNKWQMTPVTVNAYYNPTTNEITFPAAILQPPFYDATAEDAANYGTMGAIIGHELSHGFDDQGSQFDADGNMKNWWSEKDLKNFNAKKEGIITQFNSYLAIDTLHVNGELTQGENIADLGGLTMSYYAYKKSLQGKPSKVIGGFTGEQRFFIAWAQGWKGKTRDEELKRLITIDTHSPSYFRAWAPLTNLTEFYNAFDIKKGDKLYTEEAKRIEIW